MILIPMMVLSLGILTALNVHYVEKSARTALEESLKQTVDIAAGRISDRTMQDVVLAGSISSRVGALYENQITSEYNAVSAAAFETMVAKLGKTYGFMYMYVIDTNGFARTATHSNIKESNPEYYLPIVNGAESYSTDPEMDSLMFKGRYKVNVVVPIHNSGGAYIGMLVCMVDAQYLCDLVAGISVGEQGSTFIMDSGGRCIAHKDAEMLFDGEKYRAIKGNNTYSSLNKLWDEMKTNENGFSEYYYGGQRLAAYQNIKSTNNWALAVTVSEKEFLGQAEEAILQSILAALFLILGCGAIIVNYSGFLSRRITGVTDRLEAMAEGDLRLSEIRVQTTDEIGRLEASANRLGVNLHRVIERITVCLDEISDGNLVETRREPLSGDFSAIDRAVLFNKKKLSGIIHNISTTADEVSRSSSQMTLGASELAQGAAEQASSVEELFSRVSDVSDKAEILGGNAARRVLIDDEEEETNQEEQSIAIAETEQCLTEKLTKSMNRIRASSAAIRKLAADIDALASETGMLALNASVEATHAGEFGRGFAFIASEIRALADKSRKAAQIADRMIDDIMKAVDWGSTAVGYTVESVDEMVDAIAQFKNALEQISSVIKNTATTAEETASSSGQLTIQAGVLRELIADFEYDEKE